MLCFFGGFLHFFLGFLILQNLCLHGSIAVLPTVYKRVIKFVKKGEESRLVCPCRMMPAKCAACGRMAAREAKVASGDVQLCRLSRNLPKPMAGMDGRIR